MSNYLTTQEVADRLGVSVFTIRRYIRGGMLKAVRLEGAYRVGREELAAFIRSRELGPERFNLPEDASPGHGPGWSSPAAPEDPDQA